jgi:hypothetical protein
MKGRIRAAAKAAALGLGVMVVNAALAGNAQATPSNPGDPLFCQPNEGAAFLITNGGSGVFTADPDCYGNNSSNDTQLSIATGQGGSLTGTVSPQGINYLYAPPTPTFTGLDTFSIGVTTVWNSAGGTGSAGGSGRPGGPATLNITLNVIPGTTTLNVPENTPIDVPVPLGAITGCKNEGNPGQGPGPTAVVGCITAIGLGPFNIPTSETTAHGHLAKDGNTVKYTPDANFTGMDTFTYDAFGVNTDGSTALDSGPVTVDVVIAAPVIGVAEPASMWFVGLAGLAAVRVQRKRKSS